MSLICLAADVTHREICQFVKRVGYSQIASGLLLLDIKASRAAEGLLLECFMGYVGWSSLIQDIFTNVWIWFCVIYNLNKSGLSWCSGVDKLLPGLFMEKTPFLWFYSWIWSLMLSRNGSFSEVSRLFRNDLITVVFRDCGKKPESRERDDYLFWCISEEDFRCCSKSHSWMGSNCAVLIRFKSKQWMSVTDLIWDVSLCMKKVTFKDQPESIPARRQLLQFRRSRRQIMSFHIQCRGAWKMDK